MRIIKIPLLIITMVIAAFLFLPVLAFRIAWDWTEKLEENF